VVVDDLGSLGGFRLLVDAVRRETVSAVTYASSDGTLSEVALLPPGHLQS
jgi:hypothetical protein